MNKSLNKKYKESKLNITFKDFAILENSKNNFIENKERAKQYYNYNLNAVGDAPSGYVLEEDKTKVFGISKNVLVISGLLVFGSLSFYFYRRLKNK
jgi:hypothetical protein